MSNILKRHLGEVARALRLHRYEKTESGLYLNDSNVFVGGALKVHDYRDDTDQFAAISANTLLTQGLVHLLNQVFPPTGGYGGAVTAWYIAPFSGDYTPDAGLTAADFPTTAEEFEDYSGANRLALTIAAAATTPSTGNTGNQALMTFTAGGDIYGAAIVSAAGKSATTGKAFAAVRLDNPKLGMETGEKLGLEYVITAADADA